MYYDNLGTEMASSAVSDISYSLYSVSKCKENIKCKIMVDADNDVDDYGSHMLNHEYHFTQSYFLNRKRESHRTYRNI